MKAELLRTGQVRKTNIKYHQGLTKDAKATRLAMRFTSRAVFHHRVHWV